MGAIVWSTTHLSSSGEPACFNVGSITENKHLQLGVYAYKYGTSIDLD